MELIAILVLGYAIYAEAKHTREFKRLERRKQEVAELYKFLRQDDRV